MSIAANQQRTFLRLVEQLRPHWRRDAALPARIQSLLAGRRDFGSRDRRLYRELVYTTLRYLPWIEPWLERDQAEATRRVAWLAADLPATKAFRATFAKGEPPSGDRRELLPAWFESHCPELFSPAELDVQLRRAPLWLRLQTDAGGEQAVFDEFADRGWAWRRTPILPGAVEVLSEADVTQSAAWREGLIEVQDLGSQLLLEAVGVAPGERWLDACAGAGGKTLQLARMLGANGRVEAHDIRRAALDELARRAERAKQSVVILNELPQRTYDGVLVDAPCTGSGTWRRAPHLKWILSDTHVRQAAEKQRALLDGFSQRVRAGGQLVYATCSLSQLENEEVIAAFLADHRDFEAAPLRNTFGGRMRGGGLTLFPSVHDTDGFFVAAMRRR